MTTIPERLKGSPLFYELYEDEIEEFIKESTVATYKKGDLILNKGDKIGSLLIVVEGEVHVVREVEQKHLLVEELKLGDIFGELIYNNEHRSLVEVKAQSDTSILEISYELLLANFEKNPTTFGLVMTNLLRLSTKKLAISQEIVFRLHRETDSFIRTPFYSLPKREAWSKEERDDNFKVVRT